MDFERMNDRTLNEAAEFIARQQARPESHIAYFGVTAAEILSGIADFQPPNNVLLARDSGRLIGLIGADTEEETRRAWIHGPCVDYNDWHSVADALYVAAHQHGVIPAFVTGTELLGVRENTRLAEFAARHGFAPVRAANSLRFPREAAPGLPIVEMPDLANDQETAFMTLHGALFPKTYYSSAQLLEKRDEFHRILVAEQDGRLVGYIFAQMRAGDGDGYIDFLGVEEAARRQGHGKRLIAAATRWLFSFSNVREVLLTVFDDDLPAMALYTGLGFEHRQSLTGYRKNW